MERTRDKADLSTEEFSEDEKEAVLEEFWEAKEAARADVDNRQRHVNQIARSQQNPYRKRVLRWAADNWALVEKVYAEKITTGESPSGLFAATFSILPSDLETELKRGVIGGGEEYTRDELTERERELTEVKVIHLQEKMQTGSACPETERRLAKLEAEETASERLFPVADGLVDTHRSILAASQVDDPLDLR